MIQIKVMNNKKDKKKEEQEKLVENFGDGKVGEVRSYVWDLMEKPWTSDAAQWYAVFSMIVVVISTVTFVFSTLESENEEESHPLVLLTVEIIGLRTQFLFGIITHNQSPVLIIQTLPVSSFSPWSMESDSSVHRRELIFLKTP